MMESRWAYLIHLLAWALPFIFLQLAVLVRHYREHSGAVLRAVLPPALVVGVYLSVADHLAISAGIWNFGEGRHLGVYLAWLLFAVILLLSAWTPLTQPDIAERWFSLPNLFWFLPVPVLVVASMVGLLAGLRGKAQLSPVLLTLGLVFLSYSGLGISLWPNIIPPSVSIWDAAGPEQSLGFALVGTLFIVPFILMYTAWAYWVFRGKVGTEGYH